MTNTKSQVISVEELIKLFIEALSPNRIITTERGSYGISLFSAVFTVSDSSHRSCYNVHCTITIRAEQGKGLQDTHNTRYIHGQGSEAQAEEP